MTVRKVSATGTIQQGNLRVGPPAEYGAGAKGVAVALQHVQKERGLFKTLSTLSHMNQEDGFDCPGCAWPDPDDRSQLGEYCENGAKALAEETTLRRVDRAFFAKHSVEEISQWSDYKIGKSGRITEPFILRPDSIHYEPISWEEAFAVVGTQLRALTDPNEAVFYTSGRSSNEAAFLYGLMARAMGTNNMPDCSNMCHESSGVALSETVGIGKGSVTLDDFPQAELVIVMGQNPGTNHPRMLSALQKTKENGGKIISINPLREAGLIRFKNPQQVSGLIGKGTRIADLHLPVRINEDVALLKAIMKGLLTKHAATGDVLDEHFIQDKTQGYAALIDDLASYEMEALVTQSGVDRALIDEAIELIAAHKKIIICWAMGLTQHKNGVDNIRECVNLLLMKGSIGKPGAGTCPVRGHSNVQGDRTVGIMHYVSPALNKALHQTFGIDPPTAMGLDTVHCVKAMHAGTAKVFVALGGNFVSAVSDTHYTAAALQNCSLTVSVSTKLNRTHVIPGQTALILPTLGRSEADETQGQRRFVTVENSMGKVHRSSGRLTPASDQLKSEPEIVAGMAHAYFGQAAMIDWLRLGSDYSHLREKMAEVLSGFDDYEARSKAKGFYLPNNARNGDFSKLPGGRAKFTVNQPADHPLGAGEFILMTIRSHDQFNTTIYGLDDRYRGIYNERRVLMIHPEDIATLGLAPHQQVDLTSHYDGQLRTAECFTLVPYQIPRGNLAAYFPETNVLVPIDQYARGSHTPISKSIRVKITPSN
jgi:molybdopterin-dependent oxidoreductase alpha subunit